MIENGVRIMSGKPPHENLEETLKETVKHIRSDSLQNEAQVKQSVIVPILRGLDWNDTDPKEFEPESSLVNGKGDILYRANRGPMVLLKTKRPGSADSSVEEQLFDYAAHKEVPWLILTDGNLWNFYLSMAPRGPADRPFYRMELQREEEIPAYTEFLDKHLRKGSILTEEARRSVENLLASEQRRRQSSGAIPKVWRSLLESQDEILLDLLAEGVAHDCGIRPELDDVKKFLSRQIPAIHHQQMDSDTLPPRKGKTPVPHNAPRKKSSIIGYVLDGRHECKSAIQTLVGVLKDFDRRDSEFMERYARKTVGKSRRLVAQNPDDLYKNIDHEGITEDLGNGWYLGKNLSRNMIQAKIQIACKVAGVRFGTDLKLIEN